MEPTEVIIARLVLGYLKREHCRKAYEEFLRTSTYLEEHNLNKSKYISTRFMRLTLEEILAEYFEIFQIVQDRLEPTKYYKEGHSNTSLVEQLLYLLDKVQTSRASTPCPRSPLDSHLGESSPSYIEHASDVEATPAHTLPGNIQYDSEESYTHKSPRRKSQSKFVKMVATTSSPLMNKEDVSEILAQTLLENREFHEKIAHTINKVAEKQFKTPAELDETVKTVMKKTEEDPIFNRILDEIIGSSNHLDDEHVALETGSTTSSSAHINERRSGESVAEKENAHRTSQFQTVDQQNAEAIQSIVANSNLASNAQQVEQRTNEQVVVFDGSLDKYLQSDNASINVVQQQQQTIQNPLYISTTAALLIPTGVTGFVNNDANKQVVVLNNKPPAINWTAPGIITENDILTMPTVIVNDGATTSSNSDVVPVSKSEPISSKQPKTILPKTVMPRFEITADLSEYLTLNAKGEIKPKTGLRKVHYPKSSASRTEPSVTRAEPIASRTEPIASRTEPIAKRDGPPKTLSDVEQPKDTVTENAPGLNMPTACTPPPVQPASKNTPKSGTHVRNLDFSSPPKVTSAHKKRASSKSSTGSSSPHFVHKKQAAKLLFKDTKAWDADLRAVCPQNDKELSASRSKAKESSAKKRPNPKATLSAKRKRLSSSDGNKAKKKAGGACALNTTEQDGALVESALKTPEKKEKEKDKTPEAADEKKPDVTAAASSNGKPVVEEEGQDFETPETTRENASRPVTANRNIMPLLETPMKDQMIPKTPGLSTPSDMNVSSMNFTPFTKMLEDNLKGIDIGSLPTPNIPITPGFPPFTPSVDLLSPFSNRPTDYSTSSSYYQPSDNEQNKSLEAQLRQAERKSPFVDSVKSFFDKNVIGKKNLNLLRRDAAEALDSSSGTSSSSSEVEGDGDNSFIWGEKGSNDTVILKKKEVETPVRKYSLRNRSVSLDTTKKTDKRGGKIIPKKTKVLDSDDENAKSKDVEVIEKKVAVKTKKLSGDSSSLKDDGEATSKKLAPKSSAKKKVTIKTEKQGRKPKKGDNLKMKDDEKEENGEPEDTEKSGAREAKPVKTEKERISKEDNLEMKDDKEKENVTEETEKSEAKVDKSVKTEREGKVEKENNLEINDSKGRKVTQNTEKCGTKEKPAKTDKHERKSKKGDLCTKVDEKKENEARAPEETEKTWTREEKPVKTEKQERKSERGDDHCKNDDEKKDNEAKTIEETKRSKAREEKPVKTEKQERRSKRGDDFCKNDDGEKDNEAKATEDAKKTVAKERLSLETVASQEIETKLLKNISECKVLEDEERTKKAVESTTPELALIRQICAEKSTSIFEKIRPTQEKKGSSTTNKEIEVSVKSQKTTNLTARQSKVLREMEEKRQRVLNRLKGNVEPKNETVAVAKKQVNGKFKIKPIASLVCTRKKPRKSDSPKKRAPRPIISSDSDSSEDEAVTEVDKKTVKESDKSASDVEAQNLIEGLKERGIHLVQNKSPQKKIEADSEGEIRIIDCSATQIDTFVRNTFDIKHYEGEDEHIIFDESRAVETLNSSLPCVFEHKEIIGKVYLEALGDEVDVPLSLTPFETLFDIPSDCREICDLKEVSKKIIIKEVVIIKEPTVCEESKIVESTKVPRADDQTEGSDAVADGVTNEDATVDDDLMNFASTGREGQGEEPQSPASSRKRKISGGENSQQEKKPQKLLKKIDVDSFLNIIHAGTNFHLNK